MKLFFIGAKPWTAKHLECPVMVSINALQRYKRLNLNHWALIDSGAFTTVNKHGGYPKNSLPLYASKLLSLFSCNVLAVVSQDYMCESFILERTGLTLIEHQRYTIYRYKALCKLIKAYYVMPVLQGYEPDEYVDHIRQYGELLPLNAWVGVGSVCKRNAKPQKVIEVLTAIKNHRPDLKLHGFGLKKTALADRRVMNLLYSSDSFAWSFAARMDKLNADSPSLAYEYWSDINQKILSEDASLR